MAWRISLTGVAAAALAAALLLALRFSPPDVNLGDTVRIMYVHMPMAWLALGGYTLLAAFSALYLVRREEKWDTWALAAAEVGALLCTLALVTGSIWAKPAFGVWWTWSPRLTTTLILWLFYVGYLLLRAYAPGVAGPRYAAVLGLVGFADVPIVFLAVRLWRDIHPEPIVARLQPTLDPSMRLALYTSLLAFALLSLLLLLLRVALRQMELRAERLRAEYEEVEGA